jgi:hypothetical protein
MILVARRVDRRNLALAKRVVERIVDRLKRAPKPGEKLFEVDDTTFPGAGKVGLWTKADSVIHFDDFTVDGK